MWPAEVAPYDVHLVATGKDAEVFDAAAALADELEARRCATCCTTTVRRSLPA